MKTNQILLGDALEVLNILPDILSRQEPLGEEFEQVLYDNLEELIVKSDPGAPEVS